MLMLTLGRPGVRRLTAAVLCAAVLSGALLAADRLHRDEEATPAAAPSQAKEATPPLRTTQDIARYFQERGLEVDLTTAAIDEVKIPRRWDDDFKAFHEAVAESGGDLTRCKGKRVEKWTILCPGRSAGGEQVFGVLLVYKKQPVGAYLLEKPSGRVTGLVTAAQTAAPLSEEEAAGGEDFGAALETEAEVLWEEEELSETAAPVWEPGPEPVD